MNCPYKGDTSKGFLEKSTIPNTLFVSHRLKSGLVEPRNREPTYFGCVRTIVLGYAAGVGRAKMPSGFHLFDRPH